LSGGHAAWCTVTIQRKEGRVQVLAGLAPSSQTVGSNISAIHGASDVQVMNDRSKHKFHLAAKLGVGEKTVGWVETTFQAAPNRLGEGGE
jgi:hypothetical protein